MRSIARTFSCLIGLALALPLLAQAQSVKIIGLVELLGTGATSGTNFNDGVKLAVKEINAAGGILGRKVALYDDAWPFVAALVDAFTLDHCLWASDWPYLRAPVRVDYGVLLHLVLKLFPRASDRRRLLLDTPRNIFGFAS